MTGDDELDSTTCEAAIMRIQVEMLSSRKLIAVLNTSLFFILDYWPSRVALDDPFAI